jgi:UDPglucose 6-dehydrogenase
LEAAQEADALVVLTEWDEFRQLDWRQMRGVMAGSLLIDGRNMFDPAAMERLGFRYRAIGIPDGSAPDRAHGEAVFAAAGKPG